MSNSDIAELNEILLSVQSDVSSSSVQLTNAVSDMKQIKYNQNAFISEFTEIKHRCIKLENLNKKLEEKIVNLSTEIITFQALKKKNNLIIYNLEDSDEFNYKLIDNLMDIFRQAKILIPETSIVDIRRLGRKINTRPVLITLSGYMKKKEIINNAKYLRELKIYVAADLAKEEQLERKNLKACQHDLSQMGRNARIRGKLIEMDGKRYTLTEVLELINAGLTAESEKPPVSKMKQAPLIRPTTPMRKRTLSTTDPATGLSKEKKKSKTNTRDGNLNAFLSPRTNKETTEEP